MKWLIQHSFCGHFPPQTKKKLTRNYVFLKTIKPSKLYLLVFTIYKPIIFQVNSHYSNAKQIICIYTCEILLL